METSHKKIELEESHMENHQVTQDWSSARAEKTGDRR